MSTLGARLKEAREKTRLTQMEAAKKLGISNGTLSGYERNYRDPDTNMLKQMAVLYKESVDWLTDNKKPLSTNTKEFLEILELSDEEAMEKFKSRVTFKGEGLTEEQIKKIISHARFVASEDQQNS